MTLRRPVDLPWIPSMDEGWMLDVEVATMVGCSLILHAAGIPGDVLEVGAYKGRSTGALLLTAGEGRVIVVDTSSDGGELGSCDVRKDFDAEITRMFGSLPDALEIVREDSRTALPRLA